MATLNEVFVVDQPDIRSEVLTDSGMIVRIVAMANGKGYRVQTYWPKFNSLPKRNEGEVRLTMAQAMERQAYIVAENSYEVENAKQALTQVRLDAFNSIMEQMNSAKRSL